MLQALFGVRACAAELSAAWNGQFSRGVFTMLRSDSGRTMQWICRLIGVPAALSFIVATAQAQPDAVLPPIGGSGGGHFVARCPEGEVLTGFDLRAGDDIDAVRPICIPAVAGQFQAYPLSFGGDGGSPVQLVCPNDFPVVIGMEIGREGQHTITVDSIHLFCGLAIATSQHVEHASASFDGPRYDPDCDFLDSACDFGQSLEFATQLCPVGLIAVGINGRAGKWLDALGLICGAPPVVLPPVVVATPEKVVKAQGRVKLPPIDLNALHARGAEIAKAEPLAAKLRNEQGEGPARRGFEIGLAAAEWNTSPGPGKQRIRDLLNPSEQGAYDTAVTFSLALYRQKIVALALRGAEIALEDSMSAEFRSLQAEGATRRGFDIGLAAAEGHTSPGPGKQKIRDALIPAEQGGYDTAVTFSIERNTNADLAAAGAAIAAADPIVAVLRGGETDVLYMLGFDIASGIFGDPALGALGNTLTGPGSLKIRDSLSPAGQRGFNAAVDFHLDRTY